VNAPVMKTYIYIYKHALVMKSSVRYMAGDIQLLQTHWIVDAFSVRFVTWQETSIVAFERIRQQMKNEVRGG